MSEKEKFCVLFVSGFLLSLLILRGKIFFLFFTRDLRFSSTAGSLLSAEQQKNKAKNRSARLPCVNPHDGQIFNCNDADCVVQNQLKIVLHWKHKFTQH